MNKGIFGVATATALLSVMGGANASMTTMVTYNLNDFPVAVYHDSNVTSTASGACPAEPGRSGNCYISNNTGATPASSVTENVIVAGTVRDEADSGAHVHQEVDDLDASNLKIHYHADSGGLYVRMRDKSAFSLLSINLEAPEGTGNPDPNAYWEILGFSDAINPSLTAGDGTNYANRVAYQTLPSTFDWSDPSSPLLLNDDFSNISAFWIHFGGWGKVPYDPDAVYDDEGLLVSDGPLTTPVFNLYIDNITMAAAGTVNPPSNVPVPGAVWLFGSGLLGLLSYRRNNVSA
ncbi:MULTISPECIES: hypothetical protein [unclassified Methylomonas]|uniref:hypothetical protein n=1 Tax=unclassified Methylomonas TaxID=2608980 RepID=UPI0008DA5D3F|nr:MULTISPECIES: hypothetical protein [unclassified Methylomonas]OHX34070.1 hypothetical protein BJL95_06130 [Methylomonas sp. LWB]WGS84800.1 hypothetical protein QC632_17280 [Methylomonas sp. UP202]